jgi:exosortase/archaeosortase family protein
MIGLYYKLTHFIKKHHLKPLVDVFLFAVITYGLHLLWWNVIWKSANDGSFLAFLPELADWLAHHIFLQSSWFLDLIGYRHIAMDNTITFPEIGYVAVLPSCSGLKQFYQIIFLFLLYPGPWKHKAWYIPASLAVMYLVNVSPIVILSLVLFVWPEHWDFIHMWILRPFFYVVIFAEWVVWNEYFRSSIPRLRDQITNSK